MGEALVFGGLDQHRQDPGADEGDSRVHRQGCAADAAHVAEGVVRVAGVGRGIVAEVRLAYPGAAVDDEGEPADPGPEDGVADGLDARWEGEDCGPDLADDFEAHVGLAGVVADREEDSFGDCPACYEGGGEHAQGGDDGELFELGVSECWSEDTDQVDCAHGITNNMAKGTHSTC